MIYLLTKEVLDNVHCGMEAYRRIYNSITRCVEDWVSRVVSNERDGESPEAFHAAATDERSLWEPWRWETRESSPC